MNFLKKKNEIREGGKGWETLDPIGIGFAVDVCIEIVGQDLELGRCNG